MLVHLDQVSIAVGLNKVAIEGLDIQGIDSTRFRIGGFELEA